MSNLGEDLPKEMARVRDVVMSGWLALNMMRRDLDAAAKAMAEGDLPAMIAAYKALKEYDM